MVILTKRLYFSCSHQLKNRDWSDEKNRETFGRCTNLHGHNYVLEVSVKGIPDTATGMIINLHTVEDIVRKTIIEWIDHKNLNTDIDIFQTTNPTIENIAKIFWDRLKNAFPSNILSKITLYETENSWVEYSQ